MDSTSTTSIADLLESSLELLDDVEGFGLCFFDFDDVLDKAYTPGHAALDQDRALMQQLERSGDLDTNPSKLIYTLNGSIESEQDAATAAKHSPETDKPQKSTRKLRHQRQKNELEYLRNQVTELEKQLESLKNSSNAQAKEQGALMSLGGTVGDEVSSLWERVARNQRKERVKAEVENAKLRERLEGQLKIAKSLEKLLRKRPAEEDGNRGRSKMRMQKMVGLREAEVFALLSVRVDTLAERVDAVMNEAGFAVVNRERNEAQVKRDNSGRVCVELVDAKILPFAVQDVGKAVWKTLASQRIELDNGYYKALDCTDDTVRAEFCVTLRLRRAEAFVRMHILGRRMIQEGRVVMVWATFGHTEGVPFGMQRINLSECGWTLVENIAGEAPGCRSGTIVQSCVRLTPEFGDAHAQNSRAGVLSDLVIGSYGLNMQTLHQEVENHLVQGTLR
ncbi:uncharacterized protein IUM83_01062 [Phytophthora cinnamomi]|uniref:uncharacterized protein n=1 Tax=Phytophthora cinnamomi TaxID=4785 RepID=UPI00355A043F|nr:hypothetical protein IUM83_01062 [Phytophthora cinnamomi]